MIDLAKRFFSRSKGGSKGSDGSEADGHDVRVATCALLLEMSYIDGAFTRSERERMITLLKKRFGLSHSHAESLMASAHEEREESVDLWRFARLINEHYSLEEKLRIIETIWDMAYADGRLDKHEDYLVHKLAKLLRLTHSQLIDAKLKVKARDRGQTERRDP
jgi:uncharacterized tellurite resistance protein B-like protein